MATFVVRDLAICLLLLLVFTRGTSFDPTGMSTFDINLSSFQTAPSAETVSDPTEEPSAEPSTLPTVSLEYDGNISCIYIYVEINDFDLFSSHFLNQDQELQTMMANITHLSIAENAEGTEIHRKQFAVYFYDSSPPLAIVYTLCAAADTTVRILGSLIQSHEEQISVSMRQHLEAKYGDEYALRAAGLSRVILAERER